MYDTTGQNDTNFDIAPDDILPAGIEIRKNEVQIACSWGLDKLINCRSGGLVSVEVVVPFSVQALISGRQVCSSPCASQYIRIS
jgi:hypothetical protein